MPKPAVIASVARVAGGFRDAAPGHRFNLYCPAWTEGPTWTEDWKVARAVKAEAVRACTSIPDPVVELLGHMRRRQQVMASAHSDSLTVPAISTAPFATGLGNEHPVENGFAFLTPYGLPYLAGSGVKGVVRHAAEEIALFPEEYGVTGDERLTMLDVWWLFGFEGTAGAWWPLPGMEERELSTEKHGRRELLKRAFDSGLQVLAGRPDLANFICSAVPPDEGQAAFLSDQPAFLRTLADHRRNIHTRGALEFWDVFPQPPTSGPNRNSLVVEIMTPHYSKYYQGDETPHDAGRPIPVPFLAVPARSSFEFHVTCQQSFLPACLRGRWKEMLRSILRQAFDWLGFGAKTAVGYGAMSDAKPESSGARLDESESRSKAVAPPEPAREITWPSATLTWKPGPGELSASFAGKTTAPLKGEPAQKLIAALGDRANRLKRDKLLKNVAVRVRESAPIVLLGLVEEGA